MTSTPNATLVVEKGLPDAGPIPIDQDVLVFGKSLTVDVNVDSPYISRRHFQIRCQDDVCFITDLDSTNGTFLNGERLASQQERRLRDQDLIGMAGDTCDGGIIESLAEIAPMTVVRGNNDRTGAESLYPVEVPLKLEGFGFYLTLIVKEPQKPNDRVIATYQKQAVDIVVYGHSHVAFQKEIDNVLFFNPGGAGKRRFKVVPSI